MVFPIPGPGASSAQPARRRRVGLTAYQERQLKRKIRKRTCSEPWVEAQFKSADDADKHGATIAYRYHDTHVYPPGGAQTGMVRCRVCGVFNPPNAMEEGQCLDHASHRGWGPSPSALAIAALQRLNLEMEQAPLDPEDTQTLRREIEAALAAEGPKSAKPVKSRKKCKP